MIYYDLIKQKIPYLNIGAWQERSVVNGPGDRFTIWLQGCPLHCKGCINPEFQPFVKRYWISVEDLAKQILTVHGIEGVTYTGGEPMCQAYGLALLSEKLKPRELTVVCYSGYILDNLREKEDIWISRLLSNIDILIDGHYIEEKRENLIWRGSSNQRIHFLSDTYRNSYSHIIENRQSSMEFTIDKEGFVATGTWPKELLERLEKKLGR